MTSCLFLCASKPFQKGQQFNPIALRKTKIAYNFGHSECIRVKERLDPIETEGKVHVKIASPESVSMQL